MLSWPFFLKKNGTRRKSPRRTIREFALSHYSANETPAVGPGRRNRNTGIDDRSSMTAIQ
jgi:hypothetical protein